MAPRLDEAERLRRLQLVTDAALAHLELDVLLGELLTRIREILEADTAAILLHDVERAELVARAAVGLEEEVEQGVRLPVGRGFAGRIAAERRPIVLIDVDHADVLNPILREKGIKSMLGVPLITGDQVLGVLHVGTLRPRVFTDDDTELLQLAADRSAIAIQHAHVFEAEREARKRLEQLQTVTDVALTHLELDELLARLLARIREILDADTAAVLMLEQATNELVARSAVGLEEEVAQGVRLPVGGGFAGRVAAERRPIILADVDHADVLNPILREKGIKSLLGVPLIVGDEVLGVLHVGTLHHRAFSDADVDLLQLVADRAALAIGKARLHDETVRLDQLKLNFIAVASHELRTPATSVYGIASTIRERGESLPQAARDELEEALWEQAGRLRRLIEQLLDLSKLDARAIAIEPQPIALRPLLEEIATAADDQAAEILIDAGEELSVLADPVALERILSNIVANALRHGRPPVVVSADQSDRHLRIAVEDSGAGVDPELVPRLFERFERGSIRSEGTGLGLAIARAYAQAHGGELVYDTTKAGGARFELILPRG